MRKLASYRDWRGKRAPFRAQLPMENGEPTSTRHSPFSGLSSAMSVAIHPPTPPPTMMVFWPLSGSSLSMRVMASCFHLCHRTRRREHFRSSEHGDALLLPASFTREATQHARGYSARQLATPPRVISLDHLHSPTASDRSSPVCFTPCDLEHGNRDP